MTIQPDYRQLLECAQAIPWQASSQGERFDYVGPQVVDLLGYPRSDWLEPGFWLRHVHAGDQHCIAAWLQQVSGGERVSPIEYRVQAADGSLHWVQNMCVNVRRDDGDVVLSGLMWDITDTREQAAALAQVNRTLRVVNACNATLLRAVSEQALLEDICRITVDEGGYRMAWVGIAEQDAERRVRVVASHGHLDGYLDDVDIRWSDTRQGSGPTGTAIRTRQVVVAADLAGDASLAPWRERALARGYAASIALPLRDRGEVFGALSIYAGERGAFDDEAVSLLTRLADNLAYGLTALRDRERRQFSERYLEVLYASSPDMIFLFGAGSRLLDANDNALRCLGLTKAQLLGAHPERLMGQGCTMISAARHLHAARAGQDQDFEWVVRRADGSEFPVEARLRRLGGSQDPGEPRVIALVRDITERKRAEVDLAQRTAQFEAVFDSLSDAAMFADVERRMRLVNPAALAMFGYREEELVGQYTKVLYADENDFLEQGRRRFNRDVGSGAQDVYEVTYKRRDGSRFVGETRGSQVRDPDGEVIGYFAIMRDVTERRRAEAQMATLSMAVEQTVDAVSITDPQGRIEYVNPSFERTTGYASAEVLGHTHAMLKSGHHDRAFYAYMWDTIKAGQVFSDVFTNRRKDGELFFEEKIITPLRDERGEVCHFVATGRDITDRVAIQERLEFLAHHDVLTRLPNRTLFLDRVEHALGRRPEAGNRVAVLFLDLDRFKLINDSLGHDAGDRLLQVVAARLRRCVREGDTIARLGGDEFGMLLENVPDGRRVAELAQQIIHVLSAPVDERESELFVTISIGISMSPADGQDAQSLLKHADVAMYRAKELGRNNFQFYSAELSSRASERLALETDLRYALERGEFVVHYQPQVRLADNCVTGVEALLRWQHPRRGLVMPDLFIPILEETGMIVAVGEWVLRTACRDVAAHSHEGRPLQVAVNLSGRQFMVGDLAATIAQVLAETGLPPKRLCIEITESLILHDDHRTLEMLRGISETGVCIAVDDFGTGYSALSYLKRFPIDVIKIDRSFVRDISSDPDDAAIVRAIVGLARSLGLQVVAEGVSDETQLLFLEVEGCAMVQGYLYSRPGDLETVLGIDQGT